MKKMTIAMALSLVLAVAFGEEKVYHTYPTNPNPAIGNGPTYLISGPVSPGEWTSQYAKAKEYADAHHLPMIIFFGNSGCSHCEATERDITRSADFAKFLSEGMGRGIVMVYTIFERSPDGNQKTPGTKTKIPEVESRAAWAFLDNLNNFPVIGYYWDKLGPRYQYRTGGQTTAAAIIANAKRVFAGYVPQLDVMGNFDGDDTEFNRLEAEAPGPVAIRLTREGGGEAVDGTLEVSVAKANGPTSIPVSWEKSDKLQQQFVEVQIPGGLSDGDNVTLTLKNAAGEEEKSAVIHYVKKAAKPTPQDPLWIGERSFSELEYGEWTMDLDAAMKKVADDGSAEHAYTLALVQGSQWCGDCYNVDNKFLSLTNSAGENIFCRWAETNHIALAIIDVPRFATNNVETSYPSLLKRDAAEKKLGDVTALRSGLAYLTRKGADLKGGKAAAEILERNRKLVQTDTGFIAYGTAPGFHRPEDGNAYRTGVPMFVVLDKDGVVRARLTQWSASTKEGTDYEVKPEKVNDYLKRFNEMLYIADHNKTEIENNYPSAKSALFDANGVSAEASLCNADFVDTFHLEGFGGGALEKVTVKGLGDSTAVVKVEFLSTNEQGKAESLCSTTGSLADEFSLEHTFPAGDYFVRVSGTDPTSEAFAMGSSCDNHFQKYTLTGCQVLIPQERTAVTPAPASNKLTMRIAANEIYRLENMESCEPGTAFTKVEEAGDGFYRAAVSDDVTIKVYDSKHELVHQLWKSNTVGFVETTSTVTDDVCDRQSGKPLELQVGRFGGKSGKFRVSVSVNEAETTLRPDKDQDQEIYKRYELQTSELVWEDGDPSPKTVLLKIIDLEGYYDPGKVVLDLKVEEAGYDCGLASGKGKYVLDVGTKDVAAPGKAMFSRVAPYAAKAKTIYVREGDTGMVYAARFENSDGLVSVILKSSVAGVEFAADDPRDLQTGEDGVPNHFYWASHEMTEKAIYVSNVPAGKTAKITMTAFNKKGTPSKSQFKVHSSSNYVNVVGVAADSPEFAADRQSCDLYRYVYFTNAIPLKAGTYTNSAEYANKQYQKTFTKLSGTLPSGLKAVWDKSNDNLAIFGVPNVKAGTYTAVYQVSEKRPSGRSTKNVAGLTVEIVFTVVDPVDTKQPGGALNPAAATSRTIPDIAVCIPGAGIPGTAGYEPPRLMGTLQVTIPSNGRVSAKYNCATGAVSLSATSWAEDGFDVSTKALTAVLAGSGKYKNYVMGITVNSDYSLDIQIADPLCKSYTPTAHSDGKLWTKGSTSKTKPVPANTAEDWKGYYTVALVPENIVDRPDGSDYIPVAPRGCGYLTLKMDSASAWNAGKVTWAGMLPNGTALSGSTVLTRGVDGLVGEEGFAYLPIYKKLTADLVGLVVKMEHFAVHGMRSVNDAEFAKPMWLHTEKTVAAQASYSMDFDICGAIYDKTKALDECCQEELETVSPNLFIDVDALGGYTYSGEPLFIDPLTLEITAFKPPQDTMRIPRGVPNPQSISFTLDRSKGVVSGAFKLSLAGKSQKLSASYKGILLSGWGECGSCGGGIPTPSVVSRPFMNGAYYFSDKLSYQKGVDHSGNPTYATLSVKRGGEIRVEKRPED